MSRKVMTVRLDRATWVKLHAAAKRRHLTPSGVALLAVEKWLEAQEGAVTARSYELVKDLIGCVGGGDPLRSTRSGRVVTEVLKAASSGQALPVTKPRFVDFLRRSPLAGVELQIRRDPSRVRTVRR